MKKPIENNELINNLNSIVVGDCVKILKNYPDNSVDLIFADPPYNLQLNDKLLRPDRSEVLGVNENWDKFSSFETYDNFLTSWLKECQRILKPTGSIWVIGSYHNIFRVGRVIQDIGFWILNDIIWNKTNPMPNFRGRRFTNAHETIIWAAKDKDSKYKYNYDAVKSLNGDIQMRSDWNIPICTGGERIKNKNGEKSHPTQKPEALLHRILLSASEPGSIVLDPFFGTGTTGAVAKRLGRKWIGIESNQEYAKIANERISNISEASKESIAIKQTKRDQPRIPFGNLVERGLIEPGTMLYSPKKKYFAIVKVDGSIETNNINGSIHKLGAYVQGLESCNGWTFWHFSDGRKLHSIDTLREKIRFELSNAA